MFSVSKSDTLLTTSLPDFFVSDIMTQAPGEHVKLYIYLMMLSHRKNEGASSKDLARIFSCSEEDVFAVLNYWEQKKQLEVYYRDGQICNIRMTPTALEKAKESHRLSSSRVKSLMTTNEEAEQLIFVMEQYYNRPLTSTEIGTILYFLDELKFSFDLCDYLIQYCVDKGHTSVRYMETVGLSWHKKGFTTVEQAKEESNKWSKIHFEVLKAFGIKGRNPIQKEIDLINKWYNEYCFSLELISEACAIALEATGKQSFNYVEGILSKWHEKGVKTLDDVKRSNNEHRLASTDTPKSSGSHSKNQFHNFDQRTDDLDDLATKLDRQFADNQKH